MVITTKIGETARLGARSGAFGFPSRTINADYVNALDLRATKVEADEVCITDTDGTKLDITQELRGLKTTTEAATVSAAFAIPGLSVSDDEKNSLDARIKEALLARYPQILSIS